MSKSIKQAYPVTITMGRGKEIAPGTPITLPEEDANRLASIFGTVPVVEVASTSSTSSARASKSAIKALEAEVSAKVAALEEATKKVEADPSDANLDALDAAQAELAVAEKALEEARG